MTTHPWAGQKWGSRAGIMLRAVVTLVVVLAFAGPLRAAPHPERVPERPHHGIPHRVLRETTARKTTLRKTTRPQGKHASPREIPRETSRSAHHKTKAPAKSAPPRSHRSRRQQEPDNDPPLLHRAAARNRRGSVRPVAPARAAIAPLPQASANEMADVKEIPAPPATRTRGKQPFLPQDLAGRQAMIEQATQPVVLPTMYTRRGKLIVPPPLKGSHDILVHQNTMADTEGLDRIADDEALEHMQELHLLVPLRDSVSLNVNDGLPENRRYARPWAARFAMDMGRAYYARFHQPLHLNSAVRTVAYQLQLQHVNGNAAAVDGDGASPHLTGQALDFGKRGMSMAQIAWMRAYLGILMRAGKIDVEEEFQQACFHISVYKSYLPKPKMEVAAKQPLPAQP